MRKITRKCLACGENIRTSIYPNGYYNNGHYFGKLKYPIGKGEHKQVGKIKLGRKNYPVVKWTGKQKEVEYWECSKCFEEAGHLSWLEEIVEKLYGKKCRDYEHGCPCCEAWRVHETIRDYSHGKL